MKREPLGASRAPQTPLGSDPLNSGRPTNGAKPVAAAGPLPDLICLSHLRWDFVYQRPQHLLGRAARQTRVFFVEEPVRAEGAARLEVTARPEGVRVAVPHLPEGTTPEEADRLQRRLLGELFAEYGIHDYLLWYYTPMALGFAGHLEPRTIVYDCMDELSLFRGAPPALLEREAELLRRADVVFTGGRSLFEAKRLRHRAVHLFPSSIDREHFAQARGQIEHAEDQAALPTPRIGYFGVIDERMDLELLDGVAAARPDWQLVMVGPVVKIDPAELPSRPNIHYLGARQYGELPAYIAGWDVAMLPFARNDSTRFISPTKTPEYLAAGRPVVSTSIRDVVEPYGTAGLVHIADRVADFVAAVEAALAEGAGRGDWLQRVDAFLAEMSWDRTWKEMSRILARAGADAAPARGAVRARRSRTDRAPARMRGAEAAD